MTKLRATAAVLLISLICILSLSLVSCADMGAVASEDEFKELFSDVILLDREGRRDMSISSFAAFDTDDKKGVPRVTDFDDYCYIAFKVESGKSITVSEFAFFAWTEKGVESLSLEIYKASEIPTKIKNTDGTYTYYPDENGGMPKVDDDGNYIDRDDERDESVLQSENLLATASFRISSEYDSKHIEFDRRAQLTGGEYIVIKINNNCVSEGDTELLLGSFTFNYLLFYFDEVA